ncbi:creatininase family protein [Aquisphaera insulae]|uniref:creatininase family protein n=1 Tax=Aquisphaera insulae TaxID=2712864 RepID=UPI0013EDDE10|nr:creatininase family protein [Aquisphaera insulae]
MRWADLSSRRLAEVSRQTPCILALGAIEQHGPHLPVDTDRLIADALANRLDAACDGDLLILPAPPFGCSDHHMGFAGTLSLAHETFLAVAMEVLGSATRHGFRRFLLLNAHGENQAIGGVIAERAGRDLEGIDVVLATWFRLAADRLRPLVEGGPPAVGHACEFETSLVLALRPDLVDMPAAVDDGEESGSRYLRGDMLSGPLASRPRPFDRFTSSGVFGKATLATPAKGRAILKIVVDCLRELVADCWPDAPGVAGGEGQPLPGGTP